MEELVLETSNLGKRYRLGSQWAGGGAIEAARSVVRMLRTSRSKDAAPRTMWALKDVSFSIKSGERVGIIGRNGAGKSTLLKVLSRVVHPTEGKAVIRGRLTSLLEVGTGFNDALTGRENVYLNASLYGLSRSEVQERFNDIVAFSEIEKFIDTPVKRYSSGMKMRLAFAVAAHLDPDILLLDEVLAVGDLAFQRKCLDRIEGMTSHGRTLLFVSHSMDAIARYCDRCIWLDGGLLRMDGPVQDVTAAYVESVLGVRSRVVKDPGLAAANGSLDANEEPEDSTNLQSESSLTVLDGLLGDECARLLEVAIVNGKSKPASLLSTADRIGILTVYQVAERGIYVPAVGLYSDDGLHILQTVPPKTDVEAYRLSPGRYTSIAWLPKSFLNVGRYSVTVALADPRSAPMRRYYVAPRVASFHTVDPALAHESAKGAMPRDFPGVVRPMLEWTTAREPADPIHAPREPAEQTHDT
jgi:lipopolysaccharide transport system ATP-binding protein